MKTTTQNFACADDVVTVSRNKNSLKKSVINRNSKGIEEQLKINHNKTEYVKITRETCNRQPLQINYANQ